MPEGSCTVRGGARAHEGMPLRCNANGEVGLHSDTASPALAPCNGADGDGGVVTGTIGLALTGYYCELFATPLSVSPWGNFFLCQSSGGQMTITEVEMRT